MSDPGSKPVFRRPTPTAATTRPAARAAVRAVEAPTIEAPTKGIDPKIMRLALGAAGLLVLLLALRPFGLGVLELLIIGIVLLWLVSPLVGALIWQRRGGSGVIGFLGGLCLGPFVLLMSLADSGKKKCPACASWIPKEAKVCGQCRQEVSTAA